MEGIEARFIEVYQKELLDALKETDLPLNHDRLFSKVNIYKTAETLYS